MNILKSINLTTIIVLITACSSGSGSNDLPPPPKDDTIAPKILSHLPKSNAIDQSVLTSFTIIFNEDVKLPLKSKFFVEPYTLSTTVPVPCTRGVEKTTVESGKPLICQNGVSAISYGENKSTLIFSPCDPMQENRRYRITVTGVEDRAGNFLEQPLEFDISTNKSPQVCSRIPAENSEYLSLNPIIKIQFSEELKTSSLTSDGTASGRLNFSLIKTTAPGTAIVIKSAKFAPNDDATLIIELIDPLLNLNQYTASLTGGTTGLKDRANNVLTDSSWSFIAKPDQIAPTIIALHPLNGSTVSAYSGFQIQFSESMDLASLDPVINPNNFQYFITGNAIPKPITNFNFRFNQATNTAFYSPKVSPTLLALTDYRAVLSLTAKDTSGNVINITAPAVSNETKFTTTATPTVRISTADEIIWNWYQID